MTSDAGVKHYLYRVQPTRAEMLRDGPTEHETRIIGQHFEHLQRLASAGVVLMAGRTAELFPYRIAVFSSRGWPDDATAA